MFHRDQSIIADYAQASPANMARVYRFVLATIQQPLEQVADIIRSFEEEGAGSRFAFSSKRTALQWLSDADNVDQMYAMAIDRHRAGDTLGLLELFCDLPGLGPVKAGFMVQLCFGVVGCLDSHNIKRLDLSPARFAASRFKGAKTQATRDAILREYMEACEAAGGCAKLWNDWCDYVAGLRPARWESGCEVSAYHASTITDVSAKSIYDVSAGSIYDVSAKSIYDVSVKSIYEVV